eukprot:TRINITY_DN6523_c0_g3_i1.p1 TRINITY_DN6523_c0_g3~~TRINITY_DN6523_c0_g3_i1.p1  ORF type:complete len:1343 (+),score=196.41 TRINITY_DN6523_c0_g3_i1:60-4088(+)
MSSLGSTGGDVGVHFTFALYQYVKDFGAKFKTGERPLALTVASLRYLNARCREALRRKERFDRESEGSKRRSGLAALILGSGVQLGDTKEESKEYSALLAIAECLHDTRHLRVSGADEASVEGAELDLSLFVKIEKLEIEGCTIICAKSGDQCRAIRCCRSVLDVSAFVNVETITVVDCPLFDPSTLYVLAPSLKKLVVENSLHNSPFGSAVTPKLEHVFFPQGIFPAKGKPSTLWQRLDDVALPRNTITDIDPSLEYLPALRFLDLSDNRIESLRPIGVLATLERLALRGNLFVSVGALPEIATNIRYLDISNNFLSTISGLERLVHLEILDLRFNKLEEFQELRQLSEQGSQQLRKLDMTGNPLRAPGEKDGYRLLVVSFFGGRREFELDGIPASTRETAAAQRVMAQYLRERAEQLGGGATRPRRSSFPVARVVTAVDGGGQTPKRQGPKSGATSSRMSDAPTGDIAVARRRRKIGKKGRREEQSFVETSTTGVPISPAGPEEEEDELASSVPPTQVLLEYVDSTPRYPEALPPSELAEPADLVPEDTTPTPPKIEPQPTDPVPPLPTIATERTSPVPREPDLSQLSAVEPLPTPAPQGVLAEAENRAQQFRNKLERARQEAGPHWLQVASELLADTEVEERQRREQNAVTAVWNATPEPTVPARSISALQLSPNATEFVQSSTRGLRQFIDEVVAAMVVTVSIFPLSRQNPDSEDVWEIDPQDSMLGLNMFEFNLKPIVSNVQESAGAAAYRPPWETRFTDTYLIKLETRESNKVRYITVHKRHYPKREISPKLKHWKVVRTYQYLDEKASEPLRRAPIVLTNVKDITEEQARRLASKEDVTDGVCFLTPSQQSTVRETLRCIGNSRFLSGFICESKDAANLFLDVLDLRLQACYHSETLWPLEGLEIDRTGAPLRSPSAVPRVLTENQEQESGSLLHVPSPTVLQIISQPLQSERPLDSHRQGADLSITEDELEMWLKLKIFAEYAASDPRLSMGPAESVSAMCYTNLLCGGDAELKELSALLVVTNMRIYILNDNNSHNSRAAPNPQLPDSKRVSRRPAARSGGRLIEEPQAAVTATQEFSILAVHRFTDLQRLDIGHNFLYLRAGFSQKSYLFLTRDPLSTKQILRSLAQTHCVLDPRAGTYSPRPSLPSIREHELPSTLHDKELRSDTILGYFLLFIKHTTLPSTVTRGQSNSGFSKDIYPTRETKWDMEPVTMAITPTKLYLLREHYATWPMDTEFTPGVQSAGSPQWAMLASELVTDVEEIELGERGERFPHLFTVLFSKDGDEDNVRWSLCGVSTEVTQQLFQTLAMLWRELTRVRLSFRNVYTNETTYYD